MIILLQSLFCIIVVLGLYLLRSRITDIPFFAALSFVTICMWLSSQSGANSLLLGLSLNYSATVFFSALLVGMLISYAIDGPPAGRMALAVIAGSSLLLYISNTLFSLQFSQLDLQLLQGELELFGLFTSTIVMLIDFSLLTILYSFLQGARTGLARFSRIFLVVMVVQVLDGILYMTIANAWSGLSLESIGGLALTRTLVSILCSPLVYLAIIADRRFNGRLTEAELPLLGLFSVSQDFRKQNAMRLSRQEQQLRHSEQQFRELVESMQGVSWELDVASMKFTYMGPQIERITGYSPDQWTDYDFWLATIHPEDRLAAAEFCRTQTQQGRDHVFDYRLIRADGAEVWVRDSVVLIEEDGQLVKMRGVFLDITNQKRNEILIAESEERYRTLVENSTETLVVMDVDANQFVDVNGKAEEFFGLSREELLQTGPMQLSPELQACGTGSRELAMRHILAALGGQPQEFEWIHLHSDGHGIPCEVRLIRIPSSERNLLRGSITDITLRKQSELELDASRRRERELNSRLRLAADSAGLGIWEYNLSEDRIVPDERMLELYELEPADFENDNYKWLERIHPDDRDCVIARIDDAIRESAGLGIDFRLLLPGGRIRYIHSVATIFRDENGDARRMIGFNQDITERRQAEEELKRAREMELKAGEIANVGGWELDLKTEVLTWSSQTKRIHEVPDDFEPDLKTAIHFYAPEHRDLIQKAVADGIATGENWDLELDLITATGRRIRVRAVGQADYVNGEAVRLWGAFQDITERHQAEQERLNLQQQVLHTQKLESLGILSGGIAHDFNNLLTSILGNAELALDELHDNPDGRESISEIQTAAQRAAALSRQMLAYSGKGRFVIEQVDLNDFVEEMTSLLEVSISKKARLEFNFCAELPLVSADPTQVRQVIMNLITNASESLEDQSGSIRISTGEMKIDNADSLSAGSDCLVFSSEELISGHYIYFEVEDSGCGMTIDTAQRIFDPFFTTKFTGRGLGLAAVLGIVRSHAGAIRICSRVARGTSVRVLLPISDTQVLTHSTAPAREDQAWSGKGLVLLADDDELVLTVGSRMLRNLGFEVATARDGQEAVDIFHRRSDEFSLAMLDLTMPNLGGDEALVEMRRIRPDLRILICSGYDEMDIPESISRAGGLAFLQKPYQAIDLRNAVRAVLEEGSAAVGLSMSQSEAE